MKILVFADSTNTKTILDLLEDNGCSLPCNCHGTHQCHGDNYSFDCAMIPKAPITVTLPLSCQNYQSVSFEKTNLSPGPADTLLIDLGTTTVALALIEEKTGLIRQTKVFANPQRAYGSDVISRIQAALNGQGNEMQYAIIQALKSEVMLLCQKNKQNISDLSSCFIVGNTTMIHLLMGYDCKPLSASPFTVPEFSSPQFIYDSCKVHILPWISAFVGGDITAGILSCPMNESTCLLLDLGTNGELVLRHKGKWYATSTAAGPAVEGNGISCGCAAVSGAIYKVELKHLRPILSTIENKLPIGLCGSGILSLCSQLITNGYVTEEGILTERFTEEGIFLGKTAEGTNLTFTPSDFRLVQPAIAAIAAGIETLCHEANILPKDLETIFLGGAFGFHIQVSDCHTLKMFSSLKESVLVPMGNTCLQGLYNCALHRVSYKNLPDMTHIELADNDYFKEQFIHHMTYAD